MEQTTPKTKRRRLVGKIIKNTTKSLIFGTFILSSAYFSDKYNFNDRIINPIIYRNYEIAEGFTEEPFDLEKRILVNDNGELETYFGSRNSENLYKVRADGRTCYGFDSLKEDVQDIYDDIVFKIENLYEQFKNPKEGSFLDKSKQFLLDKYNDLKEYLNDKIICDE